MAEQSEFSKLSKKLLINIAEMLIDKDFPVGNPYKDYQFNEYYEILSQIGKVFSVSAVDEDVQFFSKFLEINDELLSEIMGPDGNKSLINKIVLPVAKTYDVHYDTWGSCTYEDYLSQKFDAYDKNWVEDSVKNQIDEGNFSTYDGKSRANTEYSNFEESDFEITGVYDVVDSNTIKESILDRLVIENTSEVVSSLDKQTLLKLKQIIESRLRSL